MKEKNKRKNGSSPMKEKNKPKTAGILNRYSVNNSGMTMFETLAAFVILMIVTSAFLSIIQFSSEMSMDAADRRVMCQELNERLAHRTSDTTASPAFTLVPVSEGMNSNIKLVLDTERTSKENYLGGGDTTIELRGCDVYQLPFPTEAEPEVTVLRFEYNPSAY